MVYSSNLLAINALCIAGGGAGTHKSNLAGINQLVTQNGGSTTYRNELSALNGLLVLLGGTGNHKTNLSALNALAIQAGGVGGWHSNRLAWSEIATVGISSNNAPTISNQTFYIAETAENNAVVGTVVATDPDGDAMTFAITAGNSDAAFGIDENTGQIILIDSAMLILTQAIRDKLYMWEGDINGNSLVCTDGTTEIGINGKDFATTYIPATSAATFNAPNSFNAADTDELWYNSSDVARNVTVAELLGSDFAKTFVKYDSASPHHIRAIAILKSGETLSTSEMNMIRYYFKLPLMWDGSTSLFGRIKANRGLKKKVWSADPVYDTDAQALFTRMTAAGDTPTTARKGIINQVFVDLKAQGLYTSFADLLYFFKAAAKSSANLNWLADQYNAADQGSITFTNDFGYTGTAASTTKYIRTYYNPSTNKANVSLNNFAFSFWLNEDIYNATHGLCGCYATSWLSFFAYNGSSGVCLNDNGSWYNAGLTNRSGLITVERTNSNTLNIYRNGSFVATKTLSSSAIPNLEFYLMKINGYQGSLGGKLQFFAIHRAMSAAEHSNFYSIINAYMTAF